MIHPTRSEKGYPYHIADDEQSAQADRTRYITLGEIARMDGNDELANRYHMAARNIGPPRDAIEKITTKHVTEVMEDVQWLMYGGASAVETNRYQERNKEKIAGTVPKKPDDKVLLYAMNSPEIANPVLREVYHRLGLSELRAQADGTYNDETGEYSYTMPTPWGVEFTETRDVEDDFTIYTLEAQRTDL